MSLTNKRVLVIGSQKPWLERMIMLEGIKEIVTLEYAKIESDIPEVDNLSLANTA